MTDQQLYIDGILMDMSEDSAITLDIKSNLFRDITKMTANTTYTINLPKTAHNMAVLEFAGKPSTSSKYPYIFHTARYFRNGLEIIHSGRASVLSVKETIEISIYWGLFQALVTLQSSDLKLNELNCTKYLRFTKNNSYDTYEKAITDGVFYGKYETARVEDYSEEWQGYDRNLGRNSNNYYKLGVGKILTGTETGKYVSGDRVLDKAYKSTIIPFTAGMRATISKVLGKGQFRTWAILDSNKNVISLADDAGKTEKETYPVLPAPDPMLGMFVSAGACIANLETSVAMETISIRVRAEKAGSVEYGALDTKTGETTPWGTYDVAAGETEINVVKSKPSGLLVYIKPSVDNMISMAISTAVAAYYLSDGKLSQVQAGGAYSVKYTSESEPIDVDLQATATAAWLIINAMQEYSTGDTVTVTNNTERSARANGTQTYSDDENILSSSDHGTVQPSVTVQYILDLITAQTGVAFGWSNQAKEIIKGLAVPLVTRKAVGQSVAGTLEGRFGNRTRVGDPPLIFQLSKVSEAFANSSTTDWYSQLEVKIACTMVFDVQMNWSWDASQIEATFYLIEEIGYVSNEYGYKYPPCYIEIKVVSVHTSDQEESEYTKSYIVGVQPDDDGKMWVKNNLRDMVDGRFIHLIAGRGEIELAEGDIVTFTAKNLRGNRLFDLQLYNGRLTASIKQSDEVPYGGNFPIGKNLPDIKVTDFLKCLCILTSTYPSQRFRGGTLSFADIVSLWETKAQAVDWTKKLIPSEASNHPRQTDFSVEEYCQHNIYKWKEDDTVYQQHDADMTVDNETLEYTQDVITLPFAATNGNRIPIYEWEDVNVIVGDTTIKKRKATKYKACKDRIVNLLKSDAGYAELAFNIDLQDIFDNKLEKLRKTVANPHHIVERFNLSDLEILNFDETKPVYLAQYGAYFAVLEIKTTSSGYCEVTMIELNN
ncbi:MAG: hypothetical protein U0K50_09580 [Segatella copri]|nr:hypothetical protein [Segatella copri]